MRRLPSSQIDNREKGEVREEGETGIGLVARINAPVVMFDLVTILSVSRTVRAVVITFQIGLTALDKSSIDG